MDEDHKLESVSFGSVEKKEEWKVDDSSQKCGRGRKPQDKVMEAKLIKWIHHNRRLGREPTQTQIRNQAIRQSGFLRIRILEEVRDGWRNL